MGLTVSRETAQNLTENRQKNAIFSVNLPKKRQFNINRQMV